MEKAKKITKRDNYNALLSIPEVKANQQLVDFINHELELLDRKNASATGDKKLTATQVENNKYKAMIMEHLNAEPNRLFSIGEFMKEIAEFKAADLSNQKVSRLVKDLVDTKQVERIEDKRKPFFRLAKVED